MLLTDSDYCTRPYANCKIVDLQVKQVASRLTDRRITLDVTESAREWLADTGYDPAYGARPLRRLVQTEVGQG